MSLSKPSSSLRSLALLALAASTSLVSAVPTKRQSAYTQISSWSGADFFNHFTFFTGNDPTHGLVQYVDFDTANANGYIGQSSDGGAYIGVDHTNTAPNGRQSVRITSNQAFNAGSLAVIDVNHIPVQYGMWPAIWMLGDVGTWPQSGESDIIEYVHTTPYNQMTLHTAAGCSVTNGDGSAYQGQLLNGDCNSGNANNGCGEAAYNQNSINGQQFPTAGSALNDQGGAVFVHEWQQDHISVWQFPHGQEPADLLAGNPDPSSWSQLPLAKFYGGCDFSQSLYSMQMIINIDFCGDWAGQDSVWQQAGGPSATGYATCNDYVANNPTAFQDAYFDIASIKMYSNNGQAVEGMKRGVGEFDQTVRNVTRFV